MKLTARQILALVFLAYGALFGLWLFRRFHPKRPGVLPVLTVEPDSFADIEEVAAAAVEIAKRNACVVAFEFNGIELRARPDSCAAGIVRAYRIEASEAHASEAYEEGRAAGRAEAAPIPGAPEPVATS